MHPTDKTLPRPFIHAATRFMCTCFAFVFAANQAAAAPIAAGTNIGIDFGPTPTANWNNFSQNATLPAGSVVDQKGVPVDGVSITLAAGAFFNNDGVATWKAHNADAFADLPATVTTDLVGTNGALTLSISGLSGEMAYNLSALTAAGRAWDRSDTLTVQGSGEPLTSSLPRGESAQKGLYHSFINLRPDDDGRIEIKVRDTSGRKNPVINMLQLEAIGKSEAPGSVETVAVVENLGANGQRIDLESGYYSEFSHEGFYMKDYFVYRNPLDQVYHLFYNIGKADRSQSWKQPYNEKQFGHATSEDLKTWKIHDTFLPVVPDTWESDVVSAPHVVRYDDKFYMAYTGFGPGANQRMGIATSDDLFHWERAPENPVAVGPSWTGWRERGWADFRDPGLLKWKDQWLAFNTVSGKRVAISTSTDLIHWTHLPKNTSLSVNWGHPESAMAFKRGDKVYLIASQPWQGKQMWMTEDPLSGNWETVPFNFPEGDWSGWEYIVSPEGKELLSAFFWKLNGNFIRFWELEWDGELPKLVETK